MVARWLPQSSLLEEFDRLQSAFNRLMEQPVAGLAVAGAYPPVNVWEDDENIFVEAEIPGVKLEQLEILVAEGNQLTIQGERKFEEEEKATWHRRERGVGKFQRQLTLPTVVDADKVTAKYDDGVLLITLPKSEAAKPRRIAVQAGS
ncbi:MAG: molecular chaperone Hsp20 [Gemmatales bacterium]|nr:MAG: molecular chaperone Hsp20 [Gemmatales bacterium]